MTRVIDHGARCLRSHLGLLLPSRAAGTGRDERECGHAGGVFFQRCEIKGVTVVVDYKPRRLDVAALRAGNLAEVLNITAWSNVVVQLPHVRLAGVEGWDALGSLLAQRYLNDVASSQVQPRTSHTLPPSPASCLCCCMHLVVLLLKCQQ